MGRLRALLADNAARRQADARDASLGPRLAPLRSWQAARLAACHRDLARDPRYTAAAAFFLGERYGGGDLEPRDRDFTRAAGALERLLPAAALATLEQAFALELTTQDLDARLTRALPPGPVTEAGYALAYRTSAERPEREAQLAAILELGHALDRLVAKPGPGLLLRMTHAPAEAAGLGALQGFLERGHAAFRATGGATEFLATIGSRESQLLAGLYRGDPSPRLIREA
jgi:hypothetical protein